MAGKPDSQPDRQKEMSACTILQAFSETQKKMHTCTHTPHGLTWYLSFTLSTLSLKALQAFSGVVGAGGTFQNTFQNPPPPIVVWNHYTDLVTSKYLLWLPAFPLSLPFPDQAFFSLLGETALQMLKTPTFIPHICPFCCKNNLSVKVTVFFPELCTPPPPKQTN